MERPANQIETKTNAFLEKFKNAASGLFEIYGIHFETFEQGFYGCALGKPTKRMKNALAIDREVIVVATTFRDQQQRTVKFIHQKIADAEGRLESTLAIILHCDPDGNSKLKNWGRDKGISILPIYDGDDIDSADALEKSLCMELYSHDPFDVTGPVSDDANFYGRRDEAIELARKLQRGQIRSCLGIRKVGKTSIINRVLQEINKSHDCICVMIDCSRDDIWSLDSNQFLNSIYQTSKKAIDESLPYIKLSPALDRIELNDARSRFESLALSSPKPLVMVFDEIDYVTPGSPTNRSWKSNFNPFWRNLRAAYQECSRQGRAFSMLVAGVSTYWFSVESIDGIENAALAFVPEEYLSPMPTGATIAMLRRLGKLTGLQFDETSAEAIAKATGNMPYWARKCCSYINRFIPISERPCEIKIDRVQPLIEPFVREEGGAIAEVALTHLFKVHPSLKLAATLCSTGQASQASEKDKRALRRYGVLANDNDMLSGEMIKAAFQNLTTDNQPVIYTADNQSPPNGPEIGLDEWAEELAALGKRRNLAERKLREVTLNFLRFDSMNSGTLGELLQRILKIVPEKQRAQFSHLSPEQALNKFNWTDIVKLCAREWGLFERIFGEKDQFLRNCDIINDRFDAHAKPADLADFALYRRALGYIEERLARL